MNSYDPSIFHGAITAAQAEPSAILPGLTVRDEANALVAGAIRNDALFESLHAGRSIPELQDPAVSRISDAEMKQLMIRFSAAVAWLLHLRDEKPEEYARQIDFFRWYTGNWERLLTGRDANVW
jgi:hypothetical protein